VPRLTSIIAGSGADRVLRSSEHSANDQMIGEMEMGRRQRRGLWKMPFDESG
jgi:hypothetical protein